MSEIYLVASGTGPSRQMTMPEIMAALSTGELSIEDHFWQEGRPRWEPLGTIPGLRARVSQAGPPAAQPKPPPRPSVPAAPNRAPGSGPRDLGAPLPGPWAVNAPPDAKVQTLDFWAQPAKPRYAFWSAVSYTLVSLIFTPLVGSLFIFRNHKHAGERTWRIIPIFWMVVWAAFIVATLVERIAFKGQNWLPYLIGFGGLWVFWFFTCALPHRNYLKAQPADVGWRSDWAKPLGFGFLGLVIYVIVMLLVR